MDATVDKSIFVPSVPPPQRHALIFATFDALPVGNAFEIVNDHDPMPLYYQFERVRMQIRAEAIYQLDDTAARANSVGADLTVGLSLQDSDDWLSILESVTPDEVVAAARGLDRRASVTGWLMGADS